MNYESKIKEVVIKDFIKSYNRVPSKLELIELINNFNKSYPNIDTVGFSGYRITKPQFMSESSAQEENLNADAIRSDFTYLNSQLDDLSLKLALGSIGISSTISKVQRELNGIESRLDNVLLFTQTDNPFLIGTEETFTSLNKVDFSATTASVEAFGLTCGRRGLDALNLKNVDISYKTIAEKGYLSFYNNSSNDSLKEDDGQTWNHQVTTTYNSGRVSAQLTLDLNDSLYLSQLRLNLGSFNKDSNYTASVFYSVDGRTYKTVVPAEIPIETHELMFDLGISGIKKIQILLSKSIADSSNLSNQFIYYFSIDSIKLYKATYTLEDSIAVLGPYELLDENLDPYYFTKATADLCLTTGSETAVNIYLSKDSINYYPLDNHNDFVLFSDTAAPNTSNRIHDELPNYSLAADTECEYNEGTDAILNLYLPLQYIDQIITKSIVVKRNIVVSDSLDSIDNVSPGWYFEDGLYKTTINITNPSGVILDFGPVSAYINDVLVTGRVAVPEGISTFATSSNNWRDVTSGSTSLSILRNRDTLYPYNHKLIIEGYNYPKTFPGERVYTGVEYFGRNLRYVPNEYFNTIGYDPSVYTFEETASGLKFKVKINKSLNNWSEEKFTVSWYLQDTTGNNLWVKLLLRGKTDESSPVVSSFKLRVI